MAWLRKFARRCKHCGQAREANLLRNPCASGETSPLYEREQVRRGAVVVRRVMVVMREHSGLETVPLKKGTF